MKAEILTVGTEILLGDILDTNTQFISRQLAALGIDVYFHTTVGDNWKRLINELRMIIERNDIIIITGGLGPTDDDITREAVAFVTGEALVFNEDVYEKMKVFLRVKERNIVLTKNNEKQAFVFKHGEVFENHVGTAPGLYLEKNGKKIILLPGVPKEMKYLWKTYVTNKLQASDQDYITSQFVYTYGITESKLEDVLLPILRDQTNPTVALYAKEGEVVIRITAKSKSLQENHFKINQMMNELKSIQPYIYLIDDVLHDESQLCTVMTKLLKEKNLKISFAESMTAGLLSSKVAEENGASHCLEGGLVVYNDKQKNHILNVSKQILNEETAYSTACVQQMAKHCQLMFNSHIAVSTSGIAGPTSIANNEVGDVYIGIQFNDQSYTFFKKFSGERNAIRRKVCSEAYYQIIQLINNQKQ